jgi:hypothetical protein
MRQMVMTAMFWLLANTANADMVYSFKNPSFSGVGYSSHILGVEQLGFNRQKDIDDTRKSEANKLASDLENSTLNKFLKNLESRIYATLSKQMVDSMFAGCDGSDATCIPATSGTAEVEGATITWTKDPVTGNITLIVDGPSGYTEITIPGEGEFQF